MAMSRANSNDSFAPVGSSAILEDEIESEEMDECIARTIIASEEESYGTERREGSSCSSNKGGMTASFTTEQKQQLGTSGGNW